MCCETLQMFSYLSVSKYKSNKIMLSFMDYLCACYSLRSNQQQQSSRMIMSLYYGKCLLCSAIQQVLLKLVDSLCGSIDASKLFAVNFSHCRPLQLCKPMKIFIFPAQHICLGPNFNCQPQQLAHVFHLLGGSLDPFVIWAFKNLVGSALY